MKTKCEHRCTHIYRTASSILLLVFVMVSGLYSATWNIEESPAVFSYKWEISHDDLTEFVKSGQISNSGISGSFYYQGRYYGAGQGNVRSAFREYCECPSIHRLYTQPTAGIPVNQG